MCGLWSCALFSQPSCIMREGVGFAAGALVGAVVAAAATYAYISSERKDTSQPALVKREVSDEIYREQFVRNRKFFGDAGQDKVEGAFVIVVGLGGVGSHATHLLARSGVKHIRVIDFDQVSVSSLNRHALATQTDVGISKATVLQQHLAEICPRADIDVRVEMFDMELADELFSGNPDFILDCIDNMETKVDLIKYCVEKNLKFISCMGAGAKADVSSIRYCDVSEAEGCTLAVSLRAKLRKAGVINVKIPVVFSKEKSRMSLLPLEEHQEDDPSAYKPIHTLRLRVIPVLGTMPAAMGLALASYVVCHIAGQPVGDKPAKSFVSFNVINKLHTRLESAARKMQGVAKLDFSVEDTSYIVLEIFRGRSVLSADKMHPALVCWDVTKPPTMDNIVLLTDKEAAKHAKIASISELHPEYVARVAAVHEEVRDYMQAKANIAAQGYAC